MNYEFTTTNKIIEELEILRNVENHAWIFKDGKLNTDIIYLCDIVECLKNIINNEVDKDSDEFENVYAMTDGFEKMEVYNTYNWNGKTSEVFQYHQYNTYDGFYVIMMFHRGGDVRCNYTDYVMYRFNDIEEFYDAFAMSYKIENENWNAIFNCSAWSELSDVYVSCNDDTVYDFETYECEVEEVKDAIEFWIKDCKGE